MKRKIANKNSISLMNIYLLLIAVITLFSSCTSCKEKIPDEFIREHSGICDKDQRFYIIEFSEDTLRKWIKTEMNGRLKKINYLMEDDTSLCEFFVNKKYIVTDLELIYFDSSEHKMKLNLRFRIYSDKSCLIIPDKPEALIKEKKKTSVPNPKNITHPKNNSTRQQGKNYKSKPTYYHPRIEVEDPNARW